MGSNLYACVVATWSPAECQDPLLYRSPGLGELADTSTQLEEEATTAREGPGPAWPWLLAGGRNPAWLCSPATTCSVCLAVISHLQYLSCDSWKSPVSLYAFTELCSNPIIAANAKDFVVILQFSLFCQIKCLNLDVMTWLFVFQYSFASQKSRYFWKMSPTTFSKLWSTDCRKGGINFFPFFIKKKVTHKKSYLNTKIPFVKLGFQWYLLKYQKLFFLSFCLKTSRESQNAARRTSHLLSRGPNVITKRPF